MTERRAFVTGANGFVGSSLVDRLLAEGWEVGGLVRGSSDLRFLDPERVTLVRGDVGDEGVTGVVTDAARGADVLYHVAGRVSDWGPWKEFERINVGGSRRVAAAAREAGVRRLVHVSSAAVHGFSGYRDREESDPTPPSPFAYVETKRRAEEVVREEAAAGAATGGGPEVVIVRPGNVFGPRDRVTSVPMLGVIERGLFGYVSGGRRLTCPTYIDHLVEALWRAGTVPEAAGRTYLVTDGLEITWRQLGKALADALEVSRPWLSAPRPLARAVAVVFEGLWRLGGAASPPPVTRYRVENAGNDYHFSIRRAREDLGYQPEVGLAEACRLTVEWYRSAGSAGGRGG